MSLLLTNGTHIHIAVDQLTLDQAKADFEKLIYIIAKFNGAIDFLEVTNNRFVITENVTHIFLLQDTVLDYINDNLINGYTCYSSINETLLQRLNTHCF